MIKKLAVSLTLLGVCFAVGLWAYYEYLRPFRIAMVGFSDTHWANWESAIQKTNYSLHRFDDSGIDSERLKNYNLVFVRGQGLNLTPEQVERLSKARDAGTHFYVRTATNAISDQQTSVPEPHRAAIADYMRHGGEENLIGLAHYAAHHLGGREVAVPELVEVPQFGLFHLDQKVFESLEAFETFQTQRGFGEESDKPRVVLLGSFVDPQDRLNQKPVDQILQALEDGGAKVYPMFGRTELFPMLREIQPDLILTFPHGRFGSGLEGQKVLEELGCPIVSALPLRGSREQWLADERGMEGGFMGQSITAPELDGIIEPIVVSSMEPNERMLSVRTPMDDQIDARVNLALNWLKLRKKDNADKKLVIVYYKSPGMSALSAGGLEVAPSLWNTLKRLEREGYDLGDQLPESPDALFEQIQTKGKTLGQWALGAFETFLDEAEPELIPAETYARWFRSALSPKRQKESIELWGDLPGDKMVTNVDGQPHLVVSRIQFGNVVVMPQPTVGGGGDNENEISSIHGTDQAAPHFYLGAYLWARHGFQADAIMHFGTHGSLEFTYGKSNCLSRDCWPQILIGDVPHIYPYVINNVGEALVAKRRSNAVIVSHLTPPFMESGLYGDLSLLHDKIHDWEQVEDPLLREETLRSVTDLVKELKMEQDLGLDAEALQTRLLSESELEEVHNYIHQLKGQSVTDGLHVIGREWTTEQVQQTATAMMGEQGIDQLLLAIGKSDDDGHQEYSSELADHFVQSVLAGDLDVDQLFTEAEQAAIDDAVKAARNHSATGHPADKAAASPDGISGATTQVAKPPAAAPVLAEAKEGPNEGHSGGKPQRPVGPVDQPAEQAVAAPEDVTHWTSADMFRSWVVKQPAAQQGLIELIQTIQQNASNLRSSPSHELGEILAALDAEFIAPSSGGDPLVNPASVPTGRNLFSINAEQTPTLEAWRVGVKLTDEMLTAHRASHQGEFPRQVAFSLWGGEFIRGKGTSIAQIMYLMGVRPVWNSRGVAYDVEVIPAEQLARPRIDVLVQTSGQFRDAAASRIALIDQAVQIVGRLAPDGQPNYVREGTEQTELALKSNGVSAQQARDFATARVFGAASNSSYGTQILGMVEKGDTWEDGSQVAQRYVENMSGVYRDGERWGAVLPGLLEAQMEGVDAVVHSRSSNTWGPLSLDHVYEFMGGITLAVRETTGKDPVGYFSDQRQPGRARVTTSVGAIREEARTALWNPKFIKSLQREGPSAAASMTESVRNMYGWNVMQPAAIGQDMWDETYRVYVEDKHDLQMREYFEEKNPYALQDMAAVMLETARKGYWTPGPEVLRNLAEVHTELVAEHGAACSYETCGNAAFHEFLMEHLTAPGNEVSPQSVEAYQLALASALQPGETPPEVQGIEMNEVENQLAEMEPIEQRSPLLAIWLGVAIFAIGLGLGIVFPPANKMGY
ncbi:Aerobic cobaltochelatase subunit CobN [Roseimaritima multifibrata]|uniref:Aerobic cobaltochelatase subunit CobN n=1 Tax=Roseimaritima multifibrata TaxID=1930274 RepID=A0A517MNM9_9BACT|nr:cobaltochelatase subunit CobN [Roseimaritima multifibrata]QDS96481.1 Aerobic cobaltochelatase subunit CobN [Roseimaritima multifibrata]